MRRSETLYREASIALRLGNATSYNLFSALARLARMEEGLA